MVYRTAMSEPAEFDETSHRRPPHNRDGLDTDGPVKLRKTHDRLETSKPESPHSDVVDEGVSSTDPILWGRLFDLGTGKIGSPIALNDRREEFPASKPQGYIVGRDSGCGESVHILL